MGANISPPPSGALYISTPVGRGLKKKELWLKWIEETAKPLSIVISYQSWPCLTLRDRLRGNYTYIYGVKTSIAWSAEASDRKQEIHRNGRVWQIFWFCTNMASHLKSWPGLDDLTYISVKFSENPYKCVNRGLTWKKVLKVFIYVRCILHALFTKPSDPCDP